MRRREFLTLGCAAVAWPCDTSAQQPRVPIIGALSVGLPDDTNPDIAAAFSVGLAEMGYIDGNNVKVERRWAGGEITLVTAVLLIQAGLIIICCMSIVGVN